MFIFSKDRWGRPAQSLVARLHHLEIACADPAVSADFYRRALGYSLTRCGDAIVATGPERQLLLVPGTGRTLASAGFALPDKAELAALRERLSAAGFVCENGATTLFTDAVSVNDPDGNRFVFGIAADLPCDNGTSPARPTPAARLQHVVMASRDPQAIVRFFVNVLGFTLSDDVLDGEGGVRTSFLRCSEEHHSFAVFLAAENRFDHHCYETSDWNAIRDWGDHMAAEHIAIQWGPGRHGPGNNLFIFVHDPDGNWVEISAELEIVGHDRPVGRWPHEQRTLNSWGQGLLRS